VRGASAEGAEKKQPGGDYRPSDGTGSEGYDEEESAVMVTLEEITLIQAPIERCFDLARSVEVHLEGNRHCGETAVALAGVTSGLVGMSQRVTWRAKHFSVWQHLTSEITALEPPAYFRDAMIQGVFRFMNHDHFFRTLPSGQTEMKDVFRFAAPLPVLGRLSEIIVLRCYMRALLHQRNVVIRQIAESSDWQQYLPSTLGG
jgi:ligand-binding SRPBCC domain-containing protein